MSNTPTEQFEELARRKGYAGPMNKFDEFLSSTPRGYNTGGLVTDPNTTSTTTSSNTFEEAQQALSQAQKQEFQNVANIYQWESPAITAPTVEVSEQVTSPEEFISQTTGQVSEQAPQVSATTATASETATPQEIQASIIEAAKSGDSIEALLQQYQFATGTVAPESTVQGQLSKLMQDFDQGKAPPWAAGAIRNANAIMAQRGISASSMAGQAVLQAAMEAALPIAQQDAQVNFAMQMANLNNEQQMLLQRNEARVQSLFSDIATENATRQFNAANENQVKQFNTNLRTQVDQFNTAQRNAMSEFNAGQVNAVSMFKAQMQDAREQFNAANRLIIDQANAKWRQQIATQNNATINEANRINAANLLATTLAEFNNISQSRRDAVNFAYTASENAKDRATQLLLATMSAEEASRARSAASSAAMWQSIGSFAARMFL
jgi:hypothetical protein